MSGHHQGSVPVAFEKDPLSGLDCLIKIHIPLGAPFRLSNKQPGMNSVHDVANGFVAGKCGENGVSGSVSFSQCRLNTGKKNLLRVKQNQLFGVIEPVDHRTIVFNLSGKWDDS